MKKEKSVRKAELKAAVIKQLKSLIFPLIVFVIILAGVLLVINYQNAVEQEEIVRVNAYEGSKDPMVLENDRLKFTMDPSTTQFTVEVKSTGKVWYSNPLGAEQDALAQTAMKNNLQSTVAMTYSTVNGLEIQFNNYEYSIKGGLYEIEMGDDYIRVNYSIGDTEKQFVIPPVCREADFKKWIANMDKTTVTMVEESYKRYDINNLSKRDNKEELLTNYPALETEILYILYSTVGDTVKKNMENAFEAAGYTLEDYEADKELDFSTSTSDKPVFNVNMIYRLDGDDLVVEIPMSEFEYRDEYPIYELRPLPYFGAGGMEDEGYILVPEGGGAIINFNNGKRSQDGYVANVYGWDMGVSRKEVVGETRTYFNTFAIANGSDSFLCILEEGAPYVTIRADISGRYNTYNYANAAYRICSREQYDVGNIANSSVYVYLEDLPDETLTQRYHFMDTSDYSEMAKDYREYLNERYGGSLEVKNEDTSVPVAFEVIGAVDKVKQIVGIPVSRPLALTTYSEAEEMIETLHAEGMDNMYVKLSGWCNGGVNQKILKKVKTISDLGSKKDLQSLVDSAKDMGVTVYLDGVTHYAYDSNILNGFFSYSDAARFLTKERAELFPYSTVTYSAREYADSYYLLHTSVARQMADNLVEAADKYGAGVSFRDTGMYLSSDFYKKDIRSRQSVQYEQEEYLKELSESGTKVMINMGNVYAAVYSDMVTNMDLQGSEYTILDGYVPFYQMALHGYVNYTGKALNICGNTEEELLRSAEYGAGLSFSMMQESAFILQKTLYTEYYGSDYAAWHDRMMEIYNRYNAEMGHIFNQEMTDHELVAAGVSCTTYEDGTKVYVNYNFSDATVETSKGAIVVPSRDYKVVR